MGFSSVVEEGEGMASVTAPLLPHLRNYLLEVVPATPANQSANKQQQQQPKEEKQAKGDKAAGKKNQKKAAGESRADILIMRAVSIKMARSMPLTSKPELSTSVLSHPDDEATAMDVDEPPEASSPVEASSTVESSSPVGSSKKSGQSVEAVVLEPLGLTLDVAMEVLARCHGVTVQYNRPNAKKRGSKGAAPRGT